MVLICFTFSAHMSCCDRLYSYHCVYILCPLSLFLMGKAILRIFVYMLYVFYLYSSLQQAILVFFCIYFIYSVQLILERPCSVFPHSNEVIHHFTRCLALREAEILDYPGACLGLMVTNQRPRRGSRVRHSSTAAMASLLSFTPVWEIRVTAVTTGCTPRQVIVSIKSSAT